MKAYFSHTLTGKTLLRLAVLGAGMLILFGAIGVYVLYRQVEAQESERLSLQAAERARVAEQVLGHVGEMHRTVRDEFVRRWPEYQNAATSKRFDSLLERDAEGAWRSRAEISDGRLYPNGWVRKGTALTDDVRRRVVLFHDLSKTYGPGAATRNDNLFFAGKPEQSNMGYDPYLSPTWSTDVESDYDQLTSEWGRIAYGPASPGAPTRWSTPEIDEVSPGLGPVFAGLTPIHIDGRQVATVGTTVLVKEFLARVLPSLGSEARYVAIHAEGRPLTDAQLHGRSAAGSNERAADSALGGLHARFAAVTRGGAAAYAGYSREDDMLYALARVDGPGWYVATMLPGSVLRARAAAPVLWTLAAGALALLLPLALVTAILRRQVAAPLGELTRAAEQLAGGDTTVRLPVTRNDELGRLATAFNHMAMKIAQRQQELATQRDALHQSEKLSALGGLLAGVAHELNNPLAVVVGRSYQLEESAATSVDRTRAQQVRLAAERCARIVKTFLAIARRQDAVRAPTHVNAVICDALELLDYSLQSGNVRVTTALGDDLPKVYADADQLSQVFLNLFTNAQQAMARLDGPRGLHVRSSVSADGAQVRVEVTDTGPGVAAELATRIFDPYFTTKPVGEGTGVGLAVSLGIMQAHGGALTLETPEQGGARFVVTLPAFDVASTGTDGAASIARTTHHAPTMDALGDELRILVVDDEAGIAELLRDLLEGAGHGVALAHSGIDALRYLDDQEFDVVLTDLKMPEMDGPMLYREIVRRHPELKSRVIVMTGDSLGSGANEFVRTSGLPLLDKPFEPEFALALVQRVAKQRVPE